MLSLTRRAVELIYVLASSNSAESPEMQKAFRDLTGRNALFPEDIDGMRIYSRAIMISLWAEGHVLLTYSFSKVGVQNKFPDLLRCTDSNLFRSAIACTAITTLERYGRNVCYTISWKEIEEIDLDHVWESIPTFVKVFRDAGVRTHTFPLVGLFRAISKVLPNALPANEVELIFEYYVSLSNTHSILPRSKDEFKELSGLSESARSRRKNGEAKRIFKDGVTKRKFHLGEISDLFKPLTLIRPANLSWLRNDWYSGRSHIDVEMLSQHWVPVINGFYDHIKSTKPRSFKEVRGNLNILWDYVFCYIPWWLEINPDTKIMFPRFVSDFKRMLFWKRATESELLPCTAIAMYLGRRSKVTAASFVRNCHEFFKFAIDHRVEFAELASCTISDDFENPIDISDSPGSGPRRPSDKLALPFNCIAFVRAYFFFLEEIGTALQLLALESDGQSKILGIYKNTWIDLSHLGLASSIKFIAEGVEYSCVIDEVPNVFNWHHGEYLVDEVVVQVTVPWLSCLRMLMADFFAGQRVQNFQWMNIDTFDKNYSSDSGDYYTLVQLEHDKTLPGRIIRLQTSILSILLKEKHFQLNVYSQNPEYIYYENHKSELSEPYRALFRSPRSAGTRKGNPFSDNSYSQVWLKFLVGVNRHFNDAVNVDLKYAFFEVAGGEGLDFDYKNIDLRTIRTKHTPHSMRNTYITWMLDLVELDILMGQVGHKSVTVTLHYATPGQHHIDEQLERADRAIMAGENNNNDMEVLSGSVIRPANPNSSLRQSVRENLNGAIHDQAMFSVDSENIICKESGITLLRKLPVTSFAIFNHCICPLGGFCPKEVLDVANAPHRCGICPIAVFSIDNAEAIEAQRRRLQLHIESLKVHLDFIKGRGESVSSVRMIERDLKISGMELLGYSATISVIRNRLDKASNSVSRYVVRAPEMLKKAAALTSDFDEVGMRMISRLADANAYPEYADPDYLVQLNRQLRSFNLECLGSPKDAVGLAIDHIRSYVELHGLSLKQLAQSNESIRMIDVG